MKKTIKRIVCFALVAALCLCFTGCKELDALRAQRVLYYQDSGTLILDGKTYVELPYCKEFNPPFGEARWVTITEPDVPLLLSDIFYMDYGTVSEDGRFITAFADVNFCEESIAAEVAARIKEGFHPTDMRYYYLVWNAEEYIYDECYFYLTEEQMNAVKRVMASVEPLTTNQISGNYSVTLEWCTQDGWFSSEYVDLYQYNGRYALVNWGDGYGDDMYIYEVPLEMNGIFEEIMVVYIESEESNKGYDWYY